MLGVHVTQCAGHMGRAVLPLATPQQILANFFRQEKAPDRH